MRCALNVTAEKRNSRTGSALNDDRQGHSSGATRAGSRRGPVSCSAYTMSCSSLARSSPPCDRKVCSTVTKISGPVRPCFSVIAVISCVRFTTLSRAIGATRRLRPPANIRRGSRAGGMNPPRVGWPSGPSDDVGSAGLKYTQCHMGGNGEPLARSPSRSSTAASSRALPPSSRSTARSARPIQLLRSVINPARERRQAWDVQRMVRTRT